MYSTLSKRAVVFTLKRCAMLYFSQSGGSGYEIILPDLDLNLFFSDPKPDPNPPGRFNINN